jgi:hypothetical protein
MADAKTVLGNIATKLNTDLPNTPARLASDIDATHQPVPAGTCRYQLHGKPNEDITPDANPSFYPSLIILLSVHYHLDTGEVERDWTEADMQDTLETLLDPDWWDAVTGVYAVDAYPTVGDVTRVGKVISFQVATVLTVDPNA